jgi:hypothetical protein
LLGPTPFSDGMSHHTSRDQGNGRIPLVLGVAPVGATIWRL